MAEPEAARRLAGIEAGRGIAATAVVLYHSSRHLNFEYGLPGLVSVFQFGHAGVDLFFVISGFIILFVHYSDIGRPRRLARYIGRRVTRIIPTYWVALALTISFSLLGGRHAFPQLWEVVWSSALLPSYHEPLLGVAWTLQYEVVFYALFCALILNKALGLTAFGIWLIWIALATSGLQVSANLPSSLYGVYNIEFFLGMAVAYWLKNHPVSMPRMILALGAVSFAASAIAENLGMMDGYANVSRFVYGPAAALIVLGAAEAGRRGLITVPRALQALGMASYSIYLFQFVFIGVAWKLWLALGLDGVTPHAASFGLLAGAGVAGGLVMSRLVEYPLMRLVRSRRVGPAAVAIPHSAPLGDYPIGLSRQSDEPGNGIEHNRPVTAPGAGYSVPGA